MYLDAHRYKIVSHHITENALYCVVNGVFHRHIHSVDIFRHKI